ncbi:hypothetical protein I5M32_02000 [Pedobacter sp. SD-b]|uniref:Histidine kinase-like ATPase domain-containing protein n=1 Tax=Pedobacter segetis TaxID=2793069 RepID=A0ABS1BFU4_9SPHI|nr:hypothetical protein [Pedobacter segetis]MBK0381721.1 hypothetical protein [Pedobacter segetis]
MVVKTGNLTLEIPLQITSYRFFIDQCLDFANKNSGLGKDFKRTAKFKLAIMELLTNAMKHGKVVSYLDIQCYQNEVVIKKIDNGERFTFKDVDTDKHYDFPIDPFTGPSKINAILGNNYTLLINIKGENEIEFLEPPALDYLSLDHVPENFGLMIIKQCCDTFHYRYNEVLAQNIFEVIFRF